MNPLNRGLAPIILVLTSLGGCSDSGQDSRASFPTHRLFLGHVARDLPPTGIDVDSDRAAGVFQPGFSLLPDFTGDGLSDLLTFATFRGMGWVRLGQGDGLFGDYLPFPLDGLAVGENPSSTIFDDFNGDGIQDFIIFSHNGIDSSICLYFVGLDGSVESGGCVQDLEEIGISPSTGDVNEDGIADFLFEFFDSEVNYALFLSQEDGSFVRMDEPVAYGGFHNLIDFNLDGHVDLFIRTFFRFGLAEGNGDGTFEAVQEFPLDRNFLPGFFEDLNGDGHMDMVGESDDNQARRVQSLLNNGDNTFRLAQTLVEANDVIDLIDFDGDGFLDIYSRADNVTSVFYRGNGDGTFSEAQETRIAHADSPFRYRFGRFDDDEFLDVRAGDGIYFGRGDGTFETHPILPTGRRPRIANPIDLDGNGVLDFITANVDTNDVSVLLNRGDATFEPEVRHPVGGGPLAARVLDLNGDGSADVVTVNRDTHDLSVLLGRGDGTFFPEARLPVGLDPRTVFIDDFMGDSSLDLLTENRGSSDISILAGDGFGGFAPEERLPFEKDPFEFVPEDVDGDGLTDLVVYVPEQCDGTCQLRELVLLRRNPSGGFEEPQVLATRFPRFFRTADLNRDGFLDIVGSRESDHELVLLLTSPGGAFGPETVLNTGDASVNFGNIVDIDQDGWPDLTALDRDREEVLLFFNPGQNLPVESLSLPEPGIIVSVFEVVDLNGDGTLDLIIAGGEEDEDHNGQFFASMTIFFGLGDREFFRSDVSTNLEFIGGSVVIDLNNDGLPDLFNSGLSLLSLEGFSSVMLNLGGGNFAPEASFVGSWTPVGDLDGDGDIDLVGGVRDGVVLNLNRLDQILE